MDRRAWGGWLQGPGTTPDNQPNDQTEAAFENYPGARLGRPLRGPGSVATFTRRLGGLIIDWLIALGIAQLVMRPLDLAQFAPLIALLLLHTALVGVAGASPGHRLLGLRVERIEQPYEPGTDRVPPGLWRAFIRSLLLCLVVPPLMSDQDNRGLHDRAAGTLVTRR